MKGLSILLFLFMTVNAFSQDLKNHLWEDRIILIVSKKSSEIAKKQWEELIKDQNKLTERKLIVYLIHEDSTKSSSDNIWVKTSIPYQRYKPKKGDFELTLIGLDGGIKLKRENFVSPNTIFTIIDGMPMRRNELKNKN